MANEAIILDLLHAKGNPVRYTIDDAYAVEKGALMTLLDARTVSGSGATSLGPSVAGVAAAEKVANDGATTLAVYTEGIFDLVVSATGAVAVGQYVTISGVNVIDTGVYPQLSGGSILGKALEAGSAGERIAVKLMC